MLESAFVLPVRELLSGGNRFRNPYLVVAAIVFGIAFGGLRVVVKIFLPGKIFDRPKQMEIIQLGLSGKTIDASDFY